MQQIELTFEKDRNGAFRTLVSAVISFDEINHLFLNKNWLNVIKKNQVQLSLNNEAFLKMLSILVAKNAIKGEVTTFSEFENFVKAYSNAQQRCNTKQMLSFADKADNEHLRKFIQSFA